MSDRSPDNRSPAIAIPAIPRDAVDYIRQHCPATFRKLQRCVNAGKIAIV